MNRKSFSKLTAWTLTLTLLLALAPAFTPTARAAGEVLNIGVPDGASITNQDSRFTVSGTTITVSDPDPIIITGNGAAGGWRVVIETATEITLEAGTIISANSSGGALTVPGGSTITGESDGTPAAVSNAGGTGISVSGTDGDITIGGTVGNISGNNSYDTSHGIYTPSGNLTIDGTVGDISVGGGGSTASHGIFTGDGDIAINGTVGNISASNGHGIAIGSGNLNSNGNVTISDTATVGNISGSGGSGIAVQRGHITIDGTVGNISGGNAQGIVTRDDSGGSVTIGATAMVGNVSGSGSGIQTGNGDIKIDGAVGNISGGNGYGIIAQNANNVTIGGTVGNISGSGSGIGGSNITIGGTVNGNISGSNGDGISATTIIIGGTVNGNISGGASGIYANPGGNITIGGTVSGNISGGTHGIIIPGGVGVLTINNESVVHASSVRSDTTVSGTSWGILFDGNNGMVYGNVTLKGNLTINSGQTLTVPTGSSLTVPDGITLNNNGTINNEGKITNNGTINNRGSIVNDGEIDNTDGTIYSRSGGITGDGEFEGSDTQPFPSGGGGDWYDWSPTPVTPSHTFTGGVSTFTQGSGADLTLTIQKDISLFRDVRIGTTTLTRNTQYSAESGSTVITLFADYLDTLSVGRHTLSVRFTDGASVTANFTIEEAPEPEEEPEPEEPAPITPVMPINPFEDVFGTDWFIDAVIYVYANGLMTGTSTDPMLFSPQSTLTRGMVVTVLYRHEGQPPPPAGGAPGVLFDDVPEGQWYTEAMLWAAANGIISGYGDGRYGPNDDVTREQIAAILHNYSKWRGIDVSVGENTNILSFDDAFDITEYAIPAIQWATGAGIMGGYNNNLNPGDGATRAEFAAILMRLMQWAEPEE